MSGEKPFVFTGLRIGVTDKALIVREPETGVEVALPRAMLLSIEEGMPARGVRGVAGTPAIHIRITMPAWLAREKRLGGEGGDGIGRLM
jgi:hypothetical protein